MAILGGLDVHRRQITYDVLDTDTGEGRRGQLSPATRLELRVWLGQFTRQEADVALEATPAGGSSPRRSWTPGSARGWPSRPTPGRCAAQAAGQDRPHRRPPPAGAAARRDAA